MLAAHREKERVGWALLDAQAIGQRISVRLESSDGFCSGSRAGWSAIIGGSPELHTPPRQSNTQAEALERGEQQAMANCNG